MGCFSCFDSPADEQLNPKLGSGVGAGGGCGGSSSAAAPYGAGAGGRHGDRGYPDLQQAAMVAPRVEKLSAAAEKAKAKSNALAREASAPKDANGNVISAQTFTFRELATATRNFRPECFLGEGGFGRVYKGRLESTGQVVAIKQLNRDGLQGNREFLVEVLMLSLLHHDNLVSLIGYCADGEQRLLVYEYMPFGSLEDHLHGQLTVKSDVYSFGVVLLELITGRRAIDSTRPHGEQNLVSWARPLFNDRRKLPKMADPRLEGRYPMRGLYQALAVASMCIQSEAASRPLIADVVTALSYLASQSYDPNAARKPGGDQQSKAGENGRAVSRNDETGSSGHKSPGKEREDSPRGLPGILNKDLERERMVAEAKMWGDRERMVAEAKDVG
ncbi:hypothetical protein PR202_ga01515 [Eleusine coracana subsp. coracana]|uniref:non-specific serine/threonine protein kinase n=1 Tax=Eleusine coracana subsp. coracana TaxID=191504 RepID=A0AAV5BJU6_ELECO|nr:hypothetical protein PR202_ga01515 [Eleusine coracana subsp. coracana]